MKYAKTYQGQSVEVNGSPPDGSYEGGFEASGYASKLLRTVPVRKWQRRFYAIKDGQLLIASDRPATTKETKKGKAEPKTKGKLYALQQPNTLQLTYTKGVTPTALIHLHDRFGDRITIKITGDYHIHHIYQKMIAYATNANYRQSLQSSAAKKTPLRINRYTERRSATPLPKMTPTSTITHYNISTSDVDDDKDPYLSLLEERQRNCTLKANDIERAKKTDSYTTLHSGCDTRSTLASTIQSSRRRRVVSSNSDKKTMSIAESVASFFRKQPPIRSRSETTDSHKSTVTDAASPPYSQLTNPITFANGPITVMSSDSDTIVEPIDTVTTTEIEDDNGKKIIMPTKDATTDDTRNESDPTYCSSTQQETRDTTTIESDDKSIRSAPPSTHQTLMDELSEHLKKRRASISNQHSDNETRTSEGNKTKENNQKRNSYGGGGGMFSGGHVYGTVQFKRSFRRPCSATTTFLPKTPHSVQTNTTHEGPYKPQFNGDGNTRN